MPGGRFVRRIVTLSLVIVLLPFMALPGSARESDAELAERYRHGSEPDRFLDALGDGRLARDPAPPVKSQEYRTAAVELGWALTGTELGPFDVSETDAGRREVAALKARLRARGINVSQVPYTVYSLPAVDGATPRAEGREEADADGDEPFGDVLAVPRGTTVELIGAMFDEAGLHVKTVLSAAATGSGVNTMAAPSDSRQWTPAGGLECIGRRSNNTARYDPCQFFYRLDGEDGDPENEIIASQMFGTGISKGLWELTELEVQATPREGTAAQRWIDWDPKADTKGDCQDVTVGVTVQGVGVSKTHQRCETWDIEKNEPGGDFANRWKGEIRRKDRSTASVTATKVADGDRPVSVFDFDYYAW